VLKHLPAFGSLPCTECIRPVLYRQLFGEVARAMPLINILVKRIPKQTLSIRIDPGIKNLLDKYCCFIQSGRHHVVAQALLLAFERDREFQAWLSGDRSATERSLEGNGSSSNAESLLRSESYGG
jgi:hypothetical protein